jgi:hypothetical protein
MKERRNYSRLLCSELVEVIWTDSNGGACRRIANLEDISSKGICLQSEISIPEAAQVTVRYQGGAFSGTVRYCDYRHFGYLIGVSLEDDSAWVAQQFQPEHLVDPSKLSEAAPPIQGENPAGGNRFARELPPLSNRVH